MKLAALFLLVAAGLLSLSYLKVGALNESALLIVDFSMIDLRLKS